MSSLYPKYQDVFTVKRNEQGDGNGDHVMAEHINDLQDAIISVQETLGTDPQGTSQTVSDRVGTIEDNSRLFRLPALCVYNGDPALINQSNSVAEAADRFTYFKYVILAKGIENSTFDSYGKTIELIRKASKVNFCGTVDATESLDSVKIKVQSWVNMGAKGVYLENFGYEHGVDRVKQNTLLRYIHGRKAFALFSSSDPSNILSSTYSDGMNSNYEDPEVIPGDIYIHFGFGNENPSIISNQLLSYRTKYNISIFALSNLGEEQYHYAQALSILFSYDGFYLQPSSYSIDNVLTLHKIIPVAGNFYSNTVSVSDNSGVLIRHTPYGEIRVDTISKTFDFANIQIPGYMVDATTIEEITWEVMAPEIIQAINSDSSVGTINTNKIGTFTATDYEKITAAVIEAININANNITASSIEAKIVEAMAITSKEVNAEIVNAGLARLLDLVAQNAEFGRISTNIINAVNANIGEAVINSARIEDLDASKITSGYIAVDRIAPESILADKLVIGLRKGLDHWVYTYIIDNHTISVKPTLNDIIGKRYDWQYEVQDSRNINILQLLSGLSQSHVGMFETNLVVDGSIAGATSEFEITCSGLCTVYIDGIEIGYSQFPDIRYLVKMPTLDTGIHKVQIVYEDKSGTPYIEFSKAFSDKQINDPGRYVYQSLQRMDCYSNDTTVIEGNKISTGSIIADQIQAGTLTSDSGVFGAINANIITTGVINVDILKANIIEALNAKYESLDVQNITADNVLVDTLASNIIDAINLRAQNFTTGQAQIEGAIIKDASIGTAKIQDAAIIEAKIDDAAITTAKIKDAAITNAKIDSLDATKITAGDIAAERITANVIGAINAYVNTLTAEQINAGVINADAIRASVVEAMTANIDNLIANRATIGDADIKNLAAELINALNIHAQTITATDAIINSAVIGSISADQIQANVIEAIRIAVGDVVGNTAAFEDMIANIITGQVINAANVRITSSASNDTLDADSEMLVIDQGGMDISSKPKVNVVDAYWPVDTKVIRLNKNGLAISSDGGRVWTTKLTGTGLTVTNAEVVSLEAGKITAGDITTNGTINVGQKVALSNVGVAVTGGAGIDVTTGTIQVTDGTTPRIKMGLYDDTNYGIEIATVKADLTPGYSIILDKQGLRTTSDNFAINADGSISIVGNIESGSGSIGGWLINDSQIKDVDSRVVMDSLSKTINIDSGKVVLGLYDNADTLNPKYGILAQSGKIGGLDITAEGLQAAMQFKFDQNAITLSGNKALTINTGTMVINDNGITYLTLGKLATDIYGLNIGLNGSAYIQLDQSGLRANNGTENTLSVGSDGNITIKGQINATSGTLSNLMITGNVVAGDTIINGLGISGTGYSLDGSGLIASKGTIGGWIIDSVELKNIDGSFSLNSSTGSLKLATDKIILNKDGSAVIGKLAINTDGSVSSDNFMIAANGNVTITGAITATSGSFSGEVKATSGWFGSQLDGISVGSTGLSIVGTGNISGSKFSISDTGISMTGGNINLANMFIVTNDGSLTAKSGVIGGVTIGQNSLTAGAVTLDNTGVTINTTTPITIGTAGIQSANFKLNADGSVQVTGAINSSSGYFGTSTNGVTIGTNGLEVIGNGQIKAGTSILRSSGISLGSDTSIILKDASNKTLFSANNTGMSAIAGNIGGWVIGDTTITSGNIVLNSTGKIAIGADKVVFNNDGSGNIGAFKFTTDGQLYAGSSVTDYKFLIDTLGNSHFKGDITGASGNFTGTITATDGSIGGWNINTTTLSAGNVTLDSTGAITLGSTGQVVLNSASGINIANGQLTIDLLGKIIAKDADISGKVITSDITANGGTVGGWTLASNKLSAGNITLDSTGIITVGDYVTIDGTIVDSLGRKGKLTVGNLEAVGGTIGGLTITNSSIESTNFNLSSDGTLTASNAYLNGEVHAVIGSFGDSAHGGLIASALGIWNGNSIGADDSTFWIDAQTGGAFFKGTVSVASNSVINGGDLVIESGSIIAGTPAGAHVRMSYNEVSGGEIFSSNGTETLFRVNKNGAYFMGDVTATHGTILGDLSVGSSHSIYIDGRDDSVNGNTPGIYLYDTVRENALRVVRLNNEGLYISEDGGATYIPALTSGGINANVIKDGVLTIDDSGSSASGILIRQWDSLQNDYVENVTITPSGINVLNGAITVYSDSTGEILIGGGYLRVKGLDMGVVTSNNFIGNGNFNMVSENYGVMQQNAGEIFLGRAQSSGGAVSNPTYHYAGWPDYGSRNPHTIYTFKINPDGTINNYDPTLLTSENKGTGNYPNIARSSFNPQWSTVHPKYPLCVVPADADNFCSVLDYDGNILRQLKAWKGGLFGADFTPDGNKLVVCGDDIDRKRAPWDMVVFDTSSSDPNNWHVIGVIPVGEFPSKVVCDDKGFAYATVSLDNTVYKLDIVNMRVDKILTLTDARGMAVIPMPITISADYNYIYVGGVVSDFVYEIPTAMNVPLVSCRRFSITPYPSNRGIIHDIRRLPDGRYATSSSSTTDACITIVDPFISVTDEAVTFSTDSKILAVGGPAMSRGFIVTSDVKGTVGLTTYTLDVDYTVNVHTSTITRVSTGAITVGQTVYIEYTGGKISTWIDSSMDGINNTDGTTVKKLAFPDGLTDDEKRKWNFYSSTSLNFHPTLPLLYVNVTNRCMISVLSYASGELIELQRIPCGSNPSGTSISVDGLRLYVPHHHYHTYPLGANKVWGYRSSDNFYNTEDIFDTTQKYWHQNPAGMVMTENGRYLWIANRATNKITIIDTTTWGDLNTWRYIENVGNKPYELKLNNAGTKIYVSNNDSDGQNEPDFVTVIDVATRQIEGNIYVGDYPNGIAISNDDKYLYVVCKDIDMIQKVNTANRKVVASAEAVGGPRHIHVVGNNIYVTCFDENKLCCYDASTFTKIATLDCDKDPTQMISINGKLYVCNQGADNVMIFDIATNTLENRIFVGSRPNPIAYNPVKNVIYVGNSGEGSVCIINPTTNEITEWCMTGDAPEYITVSPDGERWYVTAHGPEDIVSYGTGAPFTGDAYLDNNGVSHKYGAAYWMPSRSRWARGADNTLTSFSSVEFWPNSQLQGKEGYSHLTVMGLFDSYAMVEQDVYSLINASDGACDYKTETIDILQGVARELEEDIADYRDIPEREKRRVFVCDAYDQTKKYVEGVDYKINYKEKTIERIGNEIPPSRVRVNTDMLIETTPTTLISDANKYNTIKVFPLDQTGNQYEEGKDYIIGTNESGILTIARTTDSSIVSGSSVSVEYWYYLQVRYYYHPYKRNYEDTVLSADMFWRWPRPENQWVSMEIDELVPKPIYVDNDQIDPWQPIFDYGRGYYNSTENKVEYRDSKNNLLNTIPAYKGLVYSSNSDRVQESLFTSSVAPTSGSLDDLKQLTGEVILPSGTQYITIDIGNNYYVNEVTVKHAIDGRTINDAKVQVSSDGINWREIYNVVSSPSDYTIKFNKTYNDTTYYGPEAFRYVRLYSNGNSINSDNQWKQVKIMGDWKVHTSYVFSSNTIWDSEGIKETYLTLNGTGDSNKVRFDMPGATTDPLSPMTPPPQRVRYRIYYTREDGTHNVRGELQVFNANNGQLYNGYRSDETPAISVHYDYVYNYLTNCVWRTEDSNIASGEEVRILYHFVQENLSNLPLCIAHKDPNTGAEDKAASVAETDTTGAWVEWKFTNEYRCDWYVGWIADIGLGDIAIYLDGKLIHSISQATVKIERFSQLTPDLMPGEHTIKLVQQQGRVNFDIIKLEDYQLYYRNNNIVASPALNPVELFDWYPTKLSPGEARKYLGRGAQITSGAYDTIQVDKISKIPNHQVPIKYRVRFKTELIGRGEAVDGLGGDGGEAIKDEFKFERGSVMITNVTMELGVNPTYWRMSPAADKYPGFAIESWDISEPLHTGIQTHHIANGSITGDKIKKFEIEDIHISSNAAIQESKLELNYPTHPHNNKAFLDLMTGFGVSGISNSVARADHTHTNIDNDLMINGIIKEINKPYIVHSRPLYGLAGDLQFQTNSNTWELITNHYNLFGYAMPLAQTGATRKYRLYCVYGDNITDTDTMRAKIRIVTDETIPTVIHEWVLPNTWGSANGKADAYSDMFTALNNGKHHNIQVCIQDSNGTYVGNDKEIGIEWLELIAYDVFEEV